MLMPGGILTAVCPADIFLPLPPADSVPPLPPPVAVPPFLPAEGVILPEPPPPPHVGPWSAEDRPAVPTAKADLDALVGDYEGYFTNSAGQNPCTMSVYKEGSAYKVRYEWVSMISQETLASLSTMTARDDGTVYVDSGNWIVSPRDGYRDLLDTTLTVDGNSLIGKNGDGGEDRYERVEADKKILIVPRQRDSQEIWKRYITQGGNLEVRDEQGNTLLLQQAAGNGKPELCKMLLEHSADVNAQNNDGRTALMIAASAGTGKTKMGELFLEAGADVSLMDQGGRTALHFAVTNPNDEFLRLLLARGADVNAVTLDGATPFQYALMGYQTPQKNFEILLEAGAEINPSSGMPPLLTVLRYERTHLAKFLLEKGADPNETRNSDAPPIWLAAGLWDMELMKMLLEKGADPLTKNQSGETVLFQAARAGDVEMCKLLLEKGVDVNARNSYYMRTAVTYAIEADEMPAVRFLVENGATLAQETDAQRRNPFSGNALSESPLLLAVRTGNLEMCNFLVNHGARFLDESDDTTKLLHAAAAGGNVELCRYILNFNPDINVRDREGRTPLHDAVRCFHYDACVFLLSQGANPNVADQNGQTPMMFMGHGYGQNTQYPPLRSLRIRKLLLDAGTDMDIQDTSNQTFMDILLAGGTYWDFMSKQFQLLTGRYARAEMPDSLLAAAYEGDIPRAKLLLENGKDIGMQDKSQEGVLHFAVRGNRLEMCKFLLEAGADIHADGIYGGTPLHYAAALGHPQIAEFLIDSGAEIDRKDRYAGFSPLFWAVEAFQGTCVEALVKKGAMIGDAKNRRRLPFIIAVEAGKETYCRFFCDHGYDFNADVKESTLDNMYTGLTISRRNLAILKKMGADFNQRDQNGRTLLDYVISRQNKEWIAAVLDQDVELTIQDSQKKVWNLRDIPRVHEDSENQDNLQKILPELFRHSGGIMNRILRTAETKAPEEK